jgi:TrmH family RNA methyltransferase
VITSKTNGKVRYVRSLYRKANRHGERRFVVEGVRLAEEMIKAGQEPAFFFYTEEGFGNPRARALVEGLTSSSTEVVPVSEEVMRFMADTKTPQGVLAVAAFPEVEPVESLLTLVLDAVRDPGNLGTILRTAEAAGVGQVITVRGTVDPFSPKVVRGGMGAHFRLPIRRDLSWEQAGRALEDSRVLLADAQQGTPYYQVDWTPPIALILGGEAHGAGRAAEGLAAERVIIPMAGGVESLNVAVAASVLLFEAVRQSGPDRVATGDGE